MVSWTLLDIEGNKSFHRELFVARENVLILSFCCRNINRGRLDVLVVMVVAVTTRSSQPSCLPVLCCECTLSRALLFPCYHSIMVRFIYAIGSEQETSSIDLVNVDRYNNKSIPLNEHGSYNVVNV